MLIKDRVQFKMPRDRELLFPAVAVMQFFVDTYQDRMVMNDAGQGHKYNLSYGVDLEKEDWDFFQRIGLVLNQPSEVLNGYDMLADFSEERLAMFKNSGKHVCQAYGVMAGVGAITPIPNIRKIQLKKHDPVWVVLGEQYEGKVPIGFKYQALLGEDLYSLKDEEVTGVIGKAGWETYLAASMGLAVIELLPDDRPVTWLSKWSNQYYRVVQGEDKLDQIKSAIQNLESLLCESKLPIETEMSSILTGE